MRSIDLTYPLVDLLMDKTIMKMDDEMDEIVIFKTQNGVLIINLKREKRVNKMRLAWLKL